MADNVDHDDFHKTKAHALAKALCCYPLDRTEQLRIVTELSNKTLPWIVLNRYAPKNKEFKKFEKNEKIRGFSRPGPERSRHIMLNVVKYLKDEKAKDHHFLWGVYRLSAIQFVVNELAALNKLVTEVEYHGENLETSIIITEICSNAYEYSVSVEDISKLYDLWWLKRIANFEDLLPLCSKVNENRRQAKALSKLTESVDKSTSALSVISKRLDEFKKSVNDLEINLQSEVEARKAVELAIAKADTKIEKSKDSIEKGIANRFTTVEERFAQNSSHIKELEGKLSTDRTTQVMENRIRKITDDTKASIAALKLEVERIQQQTTEKVESIEQTVFTMTAQLSDIRDSKSYPSSSSQSYRSPLLLPSQKSVPAFKINKELDFISSWSSILKNTKFVLTTEQIISFHCLLVASPIVICDYSLVETWVQCLGWQSMTKHLAATPLWSREEDWGGGANYLFGPATSRNPRFLVIHNFDVGVVDCYLSPSILLWSLQRIKEEPTNKLFLVPKGDGQQIDPDLLEDAVWINLSDTPMNLNLKQTTVSQTSRSVGVDPKVFLEWSGTTKQLSNDLSWLRNKSKIDFSDRLLNTFERTLSAAGRYFDESSAIEIARHYQLLPWLRLKHESQYEEILDHLSEIGDSNG